MAEVVVLPDTYQAQTCSNDGTVPYAYMDYSPIYATRQEAIEWATARVQAAIDDPEYTAYVYPRYSIGISPGLITTDVPGPPRPPDELQQETT
jgi:hypothetical protein